MQHTTHVTGGHAGFSARLVGFVLAGTLQAGLIWALVAGLDIKTVTRFIPDPFKITLTKQPQKPPEAPPSQVSNPPQVFVPLPPFEIVGEEHGDGGITGDTSQPPPPAADPRDHGPKSLLATHTIPPYPPLQARLGIEGTVYLKLMIGVDGAVAGAQIVRTSGDEGLDRAAQLWVIAHWRYQPAIRGGKAVPAVADVAVKFSLLNAR